MPASCLSCHRRSQSGTQEYRGSRQAAETTFDRSIGLAGQNRLHYVQCAEREAVLKDQKSPYTTSCVLVAT